MLCKRLCKHGYCSKQVETLVTCNEEQLQILGTIIGVLFWRAILALARSRICAVYLCGSVQCGDRHGACEDGKREQIS